MINNFQFLRSVGRFDAVATAAAIPLGRLTLIYADNGLGKSTLAAILRSLATGNAIPIVERRRLAAAQQPHVVINCVGGPPPAMFQNGAWNRTLPNMVVFDEVFVDNNIYSGLVVGAGHRQNLHELILGAQGVALNAQLQSAVAQIETHNGRLRQRANAIPQAEMGGITIDEFCNLPANPNVDQEIQETERHLAASREQEPIRDTPALDLLSLPAIDLVAIEGVLQTTFSELDAAAAGRVQAHLATLGRGAETWLAEGMQRQVDGADGHKSCPFCAQTLDDSPVMAHYRAYFSRAYQDLKRSIGGAVTTLNHLHSDNAAVGFERAVRVLGERRQFWSRFCELLPMNIDTAAIIADWQNARNRILQLLNTKQSAPLEAIGTDDALRALIQTHENHRAEIAAINQQLGRANQDIAAVKQRAAVANPTAITALLLRLRATRARHTAAISTLCDAYVAEKAAKATTENVRDQARAGLEQYRNTIFPSYQAAINRNLTRFNAGFHLDSVTATNTRGGPTCTYNVVINNVPVAVGGGQAQPGDHAFRNTLSAGDRNALALAFFFASLELDQPNLANKIVVIDDPVSSLDDHRSLTTVQQIRRLTAQAAQVIVLSHSKQFLCRIWEGADAAIRVAVHITRLGDSSTIEQWNADQDSVTEHDRRHEMLRTYAASGGQNEREVAIALRPLLEAFLRVACPEHFPPGTLLGQFRNTCRQAVNTPREVLSGQDLQELSEIVEYANRFHHDTNPAWETATINEIELSGFVRRALAFVKRR